MKRAKAWGRSAEERRSSGGSASSTWTTKHLGPALLLAVIGCHSNDGSSGGATPPASTVPASGPLANLESAPFVNEAWVAQDGGAQLAFLYYPQQNVRVSATCRNGAGQLSCDALRQLRNGPPVDVPKAMIRGNISAGTKACIQLKNQIVSAHNAQGNEDGFCRFADGSLVSTGALEQYGMRIQ